MHTLGPCRPPPEYRSAYMKLMRQPLLYFSAEAEHIRRGGRPLGYLCPMHETDSLRLDRYLLEIWPVVRAVQIAQGKRLRLLDAGCGVGNESILFAMLGAEVVGIDLKPKRIETARRRVQWFQREFNLLLQVDFRLQNILDLIGTECYDLVWVAQAISHIDPVDDFLRVVARCLTSEGSLVISDYNPSNPYVYLKFLLRVGSQRHTQVLDPSSGAKVPYAVERQFPLRELERLLEGQGLTVTEYVPLGFIPGVSALSGRQVKRIVKSVECLLGRLIPSVSICYTVTAARQGCARDVTQSPF
jgi:2-polyprenyl-3-methyl-5-hydroxy-6-metoxy-1,4-benzoquinol methylase